MKAYIVTYDLYRTGQNYEGLNEAIQSYSLWAKVATTTYIIISPNNSTEIRQHLKRYIDNNDKILVAKLSGEAAWSGLGDKVTQWLRDNLAGAAVC